MNMESIVLVLFLVAIWINIGKTQSYLSFFRSLGILCIMYGFTSTFHLIFGLVVWISALICTKIPKFAD